MSKDSRQLLDPKSGRAKRLAEALRDNLKRRKAARGDLAARSNGNSEATDKPGE